MVDTLLRKLITQLKQRELLDDGQQVYYISDKDWLLKNVDLLIPLMEAIIEERDPDAVK